MRAQRISTGEPPAVCDLVVVGAGIVGLSAARALARRHPGARIAVLERETRIAAHQTSHSSGVIHSGLYYEPGSLKARLCVQGARELFAYCDERGLGAARTGKLIVACEERELGRLAELERRGRANGVAGLRRLAARELTEVEPHVRGIAGLHSPATGVVDFERVARAFAGEVRSAGGEVCLDTRVTEIREDREPGCVRVAHSRGTTRASAAVVCAGAWSDRLAVAAGADRDPRIVPFRGAYLRLRRERSALVRSNIYPVGDPGLPFLGAHLTRSADGTVMLGPTALIVGSRDAYRVTRVNGRDLLDTLAWPGTWRLARRHWRTGVAELRDAASTRAAVRRARRMLPALRSSDFEPGPAGIRAQALSRDGRLVDDFLVARTERTAYVRNAPSPAATSCLPLGRMIADEAEALLAG